MQIRRNAIRLIFPQTDDAQGFYKKIAVIKQVLMNDLNFNMSAEEIISDILDGAIFNLLNSRKEAKKKV